MEARSITYPAGALVRVADICSRPGKPGLLPINPSTWYHWLKQGRVPQGRKIGENTVVWPIETVLAIGTRDAQAAAPAATARQA